MGDGVLQSNTDRLQQVDYFVREAAYDNGKKIKTIYRFHKLVFDRGDNSLECLNLATRV